MIRRLYIHNFRCLENFELSLIGQSSILLIGKNGSGKSSIALALEFLQKIARGANAIDQLVKVKDFSRGRADVPMRFEIETQLDGKIYSYSLAIELPPGSRGLRVMEEHLEVDGREIFSRRGAQVHLSFASSPASTTNFAITASEASFSIDWHLAALPIIHQQSATDPLFVFKQWLSRILIIRPIPELITGESNSETLEPNTRLTNFGDWFTGLIALSPAAYSSIDKYLKQRLPDLKQIQNPLVGKDARSLVAEFHNDLGSVSIPFEDLSDGEKLFHDLRACYRRQSGLWAATVLLGRT